MNTQSRAQLREKDTTVVSAAQRFCMRGELIQFVDCVVSHGNPIFPVFGTSLDHLAGLAGWYGVLADLDA